MVRKVSEEILPPTCLHPACSEVLGWVVYGCRVPGFEEGFSFDWESRARSQYICGLPKLGIQSGNTTPLATHASPSLRARKGPGLVFSVGGTGSALPRHEGQRCRLGMRKEKNGAT